MVENGLYRTTAGSTVELSGTHGGISRVLFDWLEESNACIECRVDPYPQSEDFQGHFCLVWECDHCGGGYARLFSVTHFKDGS